MQICFLAMLKYVAIIQDKAVSWFNRYGIKIPIKDEDVTILKEGKVDFIGFSYYQSVVLSSNIFSKIESR